MGHTETGLDTEKRFGDRGALSRDGEEEGERGRKRDGGLGREIGS